jgi:hypothetical protein
MNNMNKNKLYNIIHSTYMCIRYPFLYPRNRFTGLHYNNWSILNYLTGKKETYKLVKNSEGKYERVVDKPAVTGVYDKAFELNGLKIKTKSYFWKTWYYIVKFFHDWFIQIFHCIPTYTEWDEVEYGMPGWNKKFGKQYLEELRAQLKKDKMLYTFRILQIKEKWGAFQLYCEKASRATYDIIHKYEDISYHTCYDCGEPATKYTSGWILPMCDKCYEKHENYKKEHKQI